jgi:hypothetical protein
LDRFFGENKPGVGDQIDVQVQALTGYVNYEGYGYYSFIGQSSDWSSTQTITIGEAANYTAPNLPAEFAAPKENPTSTPMEPRFQTNGLEGTDLWMVCTVVLVAAVAVLVTVVIVVLQSKKGNNKGESGYA